MRVRGLSLHGIVPMLVTPCQPDGRLDEPGLLRLVDHVLGCEVHGLAICGLASETHALSDAERRRIAEIVLGRVCGRLPVLVTVTAESTVLAVDLAKHAQKHGAAAIMLAPPRITRVRAAAVARHYAAVADAVHLPLMIQDAPEYIGVGLGAELISQLAREHANVRYVKTEALPAEPAIADVRRRVDEEVGIFSGNGGLYLMDTLRAGAAGSIPGCDIPDLLAPIYEAYADDRMAEAQTLFERVLPLLVYQMQSLDVCIATQKALLVHRGVIGWDGLRPPGFTLDRRSVEGLVALYEQVAGKGPRAQ